MAKSRPSNDISWIESILGNESEELLLHECKSIDRSLINFPGKDFIDRVLSNSDRSNTVLRNFQNLFNFGRLQKTGYLSILPVDQGVEHSAGASFAPNPIYFDPENLIKLAIEGGCSAVTSTLGVLGSVSRKYAHKIPFIVKLNHNQFLSYPNEYDQIPFASVDQAFNLGAIGVGATIYFGSEESSRQIQEVSQMFEYAHSLGLITILWAYLRNENFKTKNKDYHLAADLTGQANHLASTIQADIVKQKIAECNKGFVDLQFGRTHSKVYEELTSNNPIDLNRYQLLNCHAGRSGLINSGGPSGDNDISQAVKTAVINKRSGGMGLITGRKAFQKPFKEGVEILNTVQDVYLNKKVTIA
tara:strand:- start:1275 stop:2351 length:1077 start_codon:yes stop_codon:yes gene_type:complete